GIHRIVGGEDAGALEFPWQVSLRRQVPFVNIDLGHICGGSIVNEQFVVTAAHCVDESFALSYAVVVGDQNVNKKDSTEDRIGVSYVSVHLSSRVTFYFPSILLFPEAPLTVLLYGLPNRLCGQESWFDSTPRVLDYISNWVRTQEGSQMPDQLQKVDLPVVPYNVCKEYYEAVNVVHEDTMICAGPEEGGKSVCQ
ncbi:serine protease, putative, partial [Ixodes scapularis]